MQNSNSIIRLTSADVASRVPPSGGTNIQFQTPGYRIEFGSWLISEFGRKFRPFFDLNQVGAIDTGTFRGQFWQGQGSTRRIPEIGHLMANAGIMLEDMWPRSPDLVRVFDKAGDNDFDYVCERLDVIDAAGNTAAMLWVPRLQVARKDPSYDDDLVSSDGMVGYHKRKATKTNDRQLTASLYCVIKHVEAGIGNGGIPDDGAFVDENEMHDGDALRRGDVFACVDLDLEWEADTRRNYESQVHPGFRYEKGRMIFDDAAIGGPTKQELIKARNAKYQGGRHAWSRHQRT